MTKTFTNPNLKAFLITPQYNIPVHSETLPGTAMTVFCVEETPEVLAAISDFHSNALVPVKDFIAALQAVKAEIYAKRGSR